MSTVLAVFDKDYKQIIPRYYQHSNSNLNFGDTFFNNGCCAWIRSEVLQYDYSLAEEKIIMAFSLPSILTIDLIKEYFNKLSKIGFVATLIEDKEILAKITPRNKAYSKTHPYYVELDTKDYPNVMMFYSTFCLVRYIWYCPQVISKTLQLHKEFNKRWSFFKCLQIAHFNTKDVSFQTTGFINYGNTRQFNIEHYSNTAIPTVLVPFKIDEFKEKLEATNKKYKELYPKNKSIKCYGIPVPPLNSEFKLRKIPYDKIKAYNELLANADYEKLSNFLIKLDK